MGQLQRTNTLGVPGAEGYRRPSVVRENSAVRVGLLDQGACWIATGGAIVPLSRVTCLIWNMDSMFTRLCGLIASARHVDVGHTSVPLNPLR